MSWGLPERCYGVPARGGFILSDERRHAADDFDLSREWASYRDFADCVERIRHFTSHFLQTRAIAEAAHARVMRDHTYEQRAQQLLRIAAEWRSAKTVLS
jgi:spore maturation protein CgeB